MVLLSAGETVFPADALESVPFQNSFSIGTYNLNTKVDDLSSSSSQIRNGNIQIFDCESLKCIHTYSSEESAILDLKWKDYSLAAADSIGRILIFNNELELLQSFTVSSSPSPSAVYPPLILSIDWKKSDKIYFSDSIGNIGILDLNTKKTSLFQAHDASEVWTVFEHSHHEQSSVIISGADDGCFKGWDVRSHSVPLFCSNYHQAGVTSISSRCITGDDSNVFYTGSYDKSIAKWDMRNLKRPQSNIYIGGGVWRMKWKNDSKMLGVAAMYAGAKVVDWRSEDAPRIISEMNEPHQSMVYGFDWLHNSEKAATCSFYDRRFCLWEIQ